MRAIKTQTKYRSATFAHQNQKMKLKSLLRKSFSSKSSRSSKSSKSSGREKVETAPEKPTVDEDTTHVETVVFPNADSDEFRAPDSVMLRASEHVAFPDADAVTAPDTVTFPAAEPVPFPVSDPVASREPAEIEAVPTTEKQLEVASTSLHREMDSYTTFESVISSHGTENDDEIKAFALTYANQGFKMPNNAERKSALDKLNDLPKIQQSSSRLSNSGNASVSSRKSSIKDSLKNQKTGEMEPASIQKSSSKSDASILQTKSSSIPIELSTSKSDASVLKSRSSSAGIEKSTSKSEASIEKTKLSSSAIEESANNLDSTVEKTETSSNLLDTGFTPSTNNCVEEPLPFCQPFCQKWLNFDFISALKEANFKAVEEKQEPSGKAANEVSCESGSK